MITPPTNIQIYGAVPLQLDGEMEETRYCGLTKPEIVEKYKLIIVFSSLYAWDRLISRYIQDNVRVLWRGQQLLCVKCGKCYLCLSWRCGIILRRYCKGEIAEEVTTNII